MKQDHSQILQAARTGFNCMKDIAAFPTSIRLVRLLAAWIAGTRAAGACPVFAATADQAARAAVSVPANLCEANGRARPAQVMQYTLVARGSAWEVLGLLLAYPDTPDDLVALARKLVKEIDAAVAKLCEDHLFL